MNWDSTVLRFKAVEDFFFADEDAPQLDNFFGRNNTSRGMLSFAWVDASLQGYDLEDSTTIFTVLFDVVGSSGSSTGLTFTDDLADRIVAMSTGEAAADFFDGFISVGSPTSINTINTAPDKIQVKDFYPNPFREFTKMNFELTHSTNARIIIKNISGQIVYETQQFLAGGQQELILPKNNFPESGAYQVFLIAPDFTVMQKLIFLEDR